MSSCATLGLLLLATWEDKPLIGFKGKGYVTPENQGPFYNGRNSTSVSDVRWDYHPSPQVWYVPVRGRKNSPETTPMVNCSHRTTGNTDFYEHVHRIHSVGLWWCLDWNLGSKVRTIKSETCINGLGQTWLKDVNT